MLEENGIYYDNVRVTFEDGTSTLVSVTEDEDVQARVVEVCEDEGWDSNTVTSISKEN